MLLLHLTKVKKCGIMADGSVGQTESEKKTPKVLFAMMMDFEIFSNNTANFFFVLYPNVIVHV